MVADPDGDSTKSMAARPCAMIDESGGVRNGLSSLEPCARLHVIQVGVPL